MITTEWTGPKRASQFHNDVFAQAATMKGFLDKGRYVDLAVAPVAFVQRLLLTSSLAGVDQPIIAGDSVAVRRENWQRAMTEDNASRTAALVRREYDALNEATTYYVSGDMQRLAADAAEQMHPEPLWASDLPTPSGLIVFERPLLTDDLHPETGEYGQGIVMPIRAIAWSEAEVSFRDADGEYWKRPGIEYRLYIDKNAYQTFYTGSLRRAGINEGNTDTPLQVWMTDMTGWTYGEAWTVGDVVELDGSTISQRSTLVHGTVDEMRRWILAFFRLTWQKILVPEAYSPSTAERKLGLRSSRTVDDDAIKVVTLRRLVEPAAREDSHDDDGFTQFNNQWVVAGHWRNQHYSSFGPAYLDDGESNPESHRRIWVKGYVKGPAGAPMIVRSQVVSVTR